jgi:hypothetical protein
MSGIIGGVGSKSGVIGTTELDYEEGTWTPTSDYGILNGTITGISNNKYTKIGNLVNVNAFFTNSTTGTLAVGDTIYIKGLPFQPSGTGVGSLAIAYNEANRAVTDGAYLTTGAGGNFRAKVVVVSGSPTRNGSGYSVQGTYFIA